MPDDPIGLIAVAAGKGIGLCLLALACSATVADTSFTGTFSGTGRACNGTLHVRSQAIDWTSSFSTCRRSAYEVLERSVDSSSSQRMVFRLKTPGDKCLYKVLTLEQVEGTDWTASGYPSLEAFRNKDLPEWRDSSLPERLVLECPMTQWR